MSGVCGAVRLDGAPLEHDTVGRMLEAAAHRGPDGRGRWRGGLDGGASGQASVDFGHLALHATPESVGETQPLVDEAARLTLVADARIDNREELIRLLGDPAVRPDGRAGPTTDAALILAAYRRWGEACAEHLLGDFAFVLWDGRARRLYAARDVMGMRTVYYRRDAGRLLFATEVAQILEADRGGLDPFEPAVGDHLMGLFRGGGRTFHRGIEELPPAHALTLSADGERRWRYWDVDPGRRTRYRREEEYVEHFRALLFDAVRARLRSAKPVGILLSGGVDSASVAATAGWLLAREPGVSVPELRAFSFAFDDLTECDERHVSRPLAAHFDIPVTEVAVDDAWPLGDWPVNPAHRDDPFLMGHYAALGRAFGAGRDAGVGVTLAGNRGDLVTGMEIFGLAGELRRGRLGTLYRELRVLAGRRRTSLLRVGRDELLAPLRGVASARPSVELPPWIPREFARSVRLEERIRAELARERSAASARERRRRAIFMPFHVRGMTSVERSCARHGSSFADPWSARPLADFALAVPQRVLNSAEEPKRITRRAMEGVMPEASRRALAKVVPTPLFYRGLYDRERDTVRSLLTDSVAESRGYLTGSELLAAPGAYRGMDRDTALWQAITLEMWLRRHG